MRARVSEEASQGFESEVGGSPLAASGEAIARDQRFSKSSVQALKQLDADLDGVPVGTIDEWSSPW